MLGSNSAKSGSCCPHASILLATCCCATATGIWVQITGTCRGLQGRSQWQICRALHMKAFPYACWCVSHCTALPFGIADWARLLQANPQLCVRPVSLNQNGIFIESILMAVHARVQGRICIWGLLTNALLVRFRTFQQSWHCCWRHTVLCMSIVPLAQLFGHICMSAFA